MDLCVIPQVGVDGNKQGRELGSRLMFSIHKRLGSVFFFFFFAASLGSLGGVGLETGGQDKVAVVAEEMGCVGEQILRCSDILEGWIVM